MLDKVKDTIRRFGMLRNGDTVIVAVSGGVDSVALLDALKELAEGYKISIIVAHLNHSLRGKESDRDEAFVEGLAKKLGIKAVCRKIDVASIIKKGDSLQDVARRIRYDFFEEIAEKYNADRIATAHNLDDQAETVVMRFLKGAALSGLSGIPPVRGRYIRPFIDVTRKEIEDYVESSGLRFVKDSSNKSTKYLRNRIRLELMPVLECYNPAIKRDTARLAHILARDEDYLNIRAEDAYKKVVAMRDEKAVSLNLNKLKRLHDSIKARIFFMAAEEIACSSRGFYSYHAEDFLSLLSNKAPNISIDLPCNLIAYKEYDVITIERSQKSEVRRKKKDRETISEKALKINAKTTVIADDGFRIAEFTTKIQLRNGLMPYATPPHSELPTQNLSVACFDYDKLKRPLIVRNFKPGDRFVPFGMDGHKKLKDLFIEKKIPKQTRNRIPLILSGNEIIWVAGIRQAELGKITGETKRILKIECERAAQ